MVIMHIELWMHLGSCLALKQLELGKKIAESDPKISLVLRNLLHAFITQQTHPNQEQNLILLIKMKNKLLLSADTKGLNQSPNKVIKIFKKS